MLYYLFYFVLHPHFSPLNVFRYITVRTAVASITALILSLVLEPWVVKRLRALQVKQFIREEGPQSHQTKAGTPTMGGVLIVAAIAVPTLLWADLRNPYAMLALGATLAFGAIGFVDDYNKVVRRRNLGLTPKSKFTYQVLTCVAVGAVLLSLQQRNKYSTALSVPFFKNFHPELVIHSLLARPYLWSLAKLNPNLSAVSAMPLLVKIHIVNAYLMIGYFPFTRLVHVLVVPNPYLWRKPQVVRWYSRPVSAKAEQKFGRGRI
jgi:phospho-N-acetylmuramoyl-pentapeptide-transferase